MAILGTDLFELIGVSFGILLKKWLQIAYFVLTNNL